MKVVINKKSEKVSVKSLERGTAFVQEKGDTNVCLILEKGTNSNLRSELTGTTMYCSLSSGYVWASEMDFDVIVVDCEVVVNV